MGVLVPLLKADVFLSLHSFLSKFLEFQLEGSLFSMNLILLALGLTLMWFCFAGLIFHIMFVLSQMYQFFSNICAFCIFLSPKSCFPVLLENYGCLMFGAMVHYSDPKHPGALLFGPAISFLLNALGIPLGSKFTAESPLNVLCPSHAFREVGWHLSNFVNDSGGVPQSPVQDLSLSDDEEENNLAEDLERSLQIEEALEVASVLVLED
ncbi:hypothetical protein LINGRAPRIM_LOCUS2179 [Linum grandiflorum]